MKHRVWLTLIGLLNGWAFALGMVFIVDTGPWEQPLGMALVTIVVGNLTLIGLHILAVMIGVAKVSQ